MERLKRASLRLQRLVIVFMLLVPVAVMIFVLSKDWSAFLDLPSGIHLDESQITGLPLAALIGVGSLTPISHLVAFWFLYRLLDLYKTGIVFAHSSVVAIRHIGWALIGIDVVHMLQILITGPVLTYLEISSPFLSVGAEIAFLTVGLFVVLVSYVIDMGRELKEQDSLVI